MMSPWTECYINLPSNAKRSKQSIKVYRGSSDFFFSALFRYFQIAQHAATNPNIYIFSPSGKALEIHAARSFRFYLAASFLENSLIV
jgi:hypothetical protein